MNLNLLKSFYVVVLAMITFMFAGCDDNTDTEAPFLKVSPATLIFGSDGKPAEGSQASFEIQTNRDWTIDVPSEADWITLSQSEGNGSTTIQVSIPEGINDEANIIIKISNKVGTLLSETVTIKSGSVAPKEVIYSETVGSASVASPYPYVDAYTGWNKTGTGSSTVTYSGQTATVRASGLANTGSYEGASGPNVVFFGTLPANFVINKITLKPEYKNLRLTFGSSYSFRNEDGSYNNTFDASKFEVALSSDGSTWTTISYTKNDGDQATPYWILATADFTLKEVPADLYIRFTALTASSIRLDDITLATGNGGTEIDLATGGGGEEPEPGAGDGSEASPYNVASAIASQNSQLAWVKGYIVGGIVDDNNQTTAIDGPEDVVFGANVRNTAVLIADSKDETDYTKCVAVNLPSGAIRTAVNLKDNPSNLGKELTVNGTLRAYFSIPGVRDLASYKLEGGGTTPEEPSDAILSETFADSQGNFTIVDVTLPTGGTYVWTWDTYKYMKASAYISSAQTSESWLISPAFNLTGITSAVLSFDHAGRFYTANKLTEQVVLVSTNYSSGAPSTATWTPLTIPNWSTGSDWSFISSGDINLSSVVGNANVRIAFKYASTTSGAATWEIKNVIVK